MSIKHGLKGPNHAVVTACSTGAHAIGDAARLIALDDADVMVAGGTESPLCRLGWPGSPPAGHFRPASTISRSERRGPTTAIATASSWAKARASWCLKSYEHAKARGAKIYAEVIGYGLSGDAYHITAPAENGDGAYRCMQVALKRANVAPADIDYVNAHGTSTPMGDEIELGAVERLFGKRRAASPCRRQNPRPDICSGRRGR